MASQKPQRLENVEGKITWIECHFGFLDISSPIKTNCYLGVNLFKDENVLDLTEKFSIGDKLRVNAILNTNASTKIKMAYRAVKVLAPKQQDPVNRDVTSSRSLTANRDIRINSELENVRNSELENVRVNENENLFDSGYQEGIIVKLVEENGQILPRKSVDYVHFRLLSVRNYLRAKTVKIGSCVKFKQSGKTASEVWVIDSEENINNCPSEVVPICPEGSIFNGNGFIESLYDTYGFISESQTNELVFFSIDVVKFQKFNTRVKIGQHVKFEAESVKTLPAKAKWDATKVYVIESKENESRPRNFAYQ